MPLISVEELAENANNRFENRNKYNYVEKLPIVINFYKN